MPSFLVQRTCFGFSVTIEWLSANHNSDLCPHASLAKSNRNSWGIIMGVMSMRQRKLDGWGGVPVGRGSLGSFWKIVVRATPLSAQVQEPNNKTTQSMTADSEYWGWSYTEYMLTFLGKAFLPPVHDKRYKCIGRKKRITASKGRLQIYHRADYSTYSWCKKRI